MPPRRNARKQQSSSHVMQQHTPSVRPSPSIYPSPLPDESDESEGPTNQLFTMDTATDLHSDLLDEGAPLFSFDEQDGLVEDDPPGHHRSPVLSREPTPYESLSRTVKSSIHTVRSSIPIPSAGLSPPTVSRPVSFGSFLTGHNPAEGIAGTRDGVMHDIDDDTFFHPTSTSGSPQTNDPDPIMWTRWDSVDNHRLLFLAYETGLQVWDCTNLSCVVEVLNINSGERVVCAGVLPSVRQDAPVIGILTCAPSVLSFYSLYTHTVVKRIVLPGTENSHGGEFTANEDWIVVSSTSPPALHTLLAGSLELIQTIPDTELTTIIPSQIKSNSQDNVLLENTQHLDTDVSDNNNTSHSLHSPHSTDTLPVFALHGRLLAYASIQHKSPKGSLISLDRSKVSGVNGAEMALKVGGTVLTGIRTLGGIAYRYGAKNWAEYHGTPPEPELAPTTPQLPSSRSMSVSMAGISRLFSKSAPADTGRTHQRSESRHQREHAASQVTVLPKTSPSIDNGYHVSVLDLSLSPRSEDLDSEANVFPLTVEPHILCNFPASKNQRIAKLEWSADGTSLFVVPKDGQVTKVYQLRPSGIAAGDVVPHHIYSLKRGVTSAIVQTVTCASDGRWVAVGSQKRTVHIFAVNPYGGKPDGRSHVQGRVFNATEPQSLGVDLSPIVRLRAIKVPPNKVYRIPALAVTFLESPLSVTGVTFPATLLPPATSPCFSPSSLPKISSSPSNISDPSHSPRLPKRRVDYQDILIFDSADGQLSLKRLFLDLRGKNDAPRNSGGYGLSTVSSALSAGATSISLPTNRMSVSASPSHGTGLHAQMNQGTSKPSALSQMMESEGTELVAKDNIVATWNLQRKRDWADLRKSFNIGPSAELIQKTKLNRGDWLAEVELSTFSSSMRMVPRSIYLSHQFTFHTLGEDYHALIRRYQFDFSGNKFEVRKAVEVSAYSDSLGGTTGESFVEGFSSPKHVQRNSSSFDGPLASALSGDFEYHRTTPVLPMLPNGIPGKGPKLFTNSIPIRHTMDGMSESLGKLRREMHGRKLKSPPFVPRPNDDSLSSSVPLEFDEEDEDFMINDAEPTLPLNSKDGDESSRSPSREAVTVSTPATSTHEVVDLQSKDPSDINDIWQEGWGSEDRQAIEEAERFDHISVVGFMDEEQQEERKQAQIFTASPTAGGKKKGKGRKKRL